MAERKMTEALQDTKYRTATDRVADKRRAILDPDVGAFIKAGAMDSSATDHHQPSVGDAPADVQLNTRVPSALYQRARRAVFESQMSKAEPGTIQDLVSMALHAELKRLGF